MPRSKFIIFLIIAIAFIVRFYQLGVVPLSLNWDEVSNSYNAYSILKTGQDEYGNFLPVTNRSFDDYKPPLYMYLDVPFVALLGLNNVSARLPSAILGLGSVVFVYLLSKQLFSKERISLLTAAFFAIAPWTSHFSRVGFEANLGLFFTLGTFTFLFFSFDKNYSLRKKYTSLFFAAIFFVASIYSYHSTRIIAPLLSIIFVIIFKKDIFNFSKKFIILLLFLAFIFLLPILVFSPTGSFANRLETTALSAITKDLDASVKLIDEDNTSHQKLSKIIHNRRVVIAISAFQRYMSHFDVNYLFISGDDNFRHHIEQSGLLYLFLLPIFLVGLYLVIKKQTKKGLFLISWLILSPVPASLGDAFPHAIRSFNIVFPIIALSALGLNKLALTVKSKRFFTLFSVLIISLSFFVYTHNYFTHYNLQESAWWQYGYKEAVLESDKLSNDYDNIIVDKSIEQGYIFWLYYLKYDPGAYQKRVNKNTINNFLFDDTTPKSPKDLFISTAKKFPADYKLIKTIYDPNGDEIIKMGNLPPVTLNSVP